MQSFEILGKTVGPDSPTFIIAEAGSNHNGDIARAHQLIDVAADARTDAVKFQTFRAQRLYPKSAGRSDYLGVETSIYDIIEAMEMPYEWLPELRDHSHERGLAFLSTPFHEEAVELLDDYVDAFKLASYELTHDPLLQNTAGRGKPVILSTGASELADVAHALAVLKGAGAEHIVLLQCTAAYPAPPTSANVRALVTLRDQFEVMTGLSDHTRDATAAPMAAAALGAVVIEKHFTMSNSLDGPDHAFAVEPDELADLVNGVRAIESVLGDGEKLVLEVEAELYGFARRSIFTTAPIVAGQTFSRDNVDVLRAGKLGKGLSPGELPRVLNATAARDLTPESPLQVADVNFGDNE